MDRFVSDYIGIDKTNLVFPTFAARERVIPVASGAMLTGKDRVSHQLIPRQTLKGNRLAHVETSTDHHSVTEWFGIGALL